MFTKEVKGKVGIAFVTKQTLGSDHCYLGLRPTVDTALIPLQPVFGSIHPKFQNRAARKLELGHGHDP